MKINSIRYGIEEGGARIGLPTIFIEFYKNNYDELEEFEERDAKFVFNKIHKYEPCRSVTLTGGDPLKYADSKEFYNLLNLLACSGYEINIETHGTIPFNLFILEMAPYLSTQIFFTLVIDCNEESVGDICLDNITGVRECDVIDFVVYDVDNLHLMNYLIKEYNIRAQVFVGTDNIFSPLEVEDIIEFLQEYRLVNCRVQNRFEF